MTIIWYKVEIFLVRGSIEPFCKSDKVCGNK